MSRVPRMMLSYVIVAALGLLLSLYLFPSLAFNKEGKLRSISGMICQMKPLGHFLMSLGNLMVFLILSIEFKLTAWLYWVTLQLILSFDVDDFPRMHFLSLVSFIVLLLYFWYEACNKHNLWQQAIPLFVTSGLFTLLMLSQLIVLGPRQPWPYHSTQSFIEILWLISTVYLIWAYEDLLQRDHGMAVHALVDI